MDSVILQSIITFLGVLVGSGIIQFFVNRKDKQIEDEKNDKLKAMDEKFQKGLDEREAKGLERYNEHKVAIAEMSLQHQKDFQQLKDAIKQLTENDTNIAKLIERNEQTIGTIADGLVGMIHNTIIYTTEPILKRDAVTYEELATLDSLYVPYSKLGGNGECKRRYYDVNKLTKISKEEADKRDRAIEKRKLEEVKETICAR